MTTAAAAAAAAAAEDVMMMIMIVVRGQMAVHVMTALPTSLPARPSASDVCVVQAEAAVRATHSARGRKRMSRSRGVCQKGKGALLTTTTVAQMIRLALVAGVVMMMVSIMMMMMVMMMRAMAMMMMTSPCT